MITMYIYLSLSSKSPIAISWPLRFFAVFFQGNDFPEIAFLALNPFTIF